MSESHLQEQHLRVSASTLPKAKGTRMERALHGKVFTPLQEATIAECPLGRHKALCGHQSLCHLQLH